MTIAELARAARLLRSPTRRRGRSILVLAGLTADSFGCGASEQVFINLLENAAKYSTGSIAHRRAAAAAEVTIEVSDEGPGIPPAQRLRIFEKFQRAAPESGSGGVGLGLAICRAIVTAHGGRIWVQERDGGGSAFRLTLPVQGSPPVMFSDGTEPPEPAA